MFKEYEKNGRVIHATDFAYEAIYKAQGYKPRGEKNGLFTLGFETETPATKNVRTAGSDKANSGVGVGTPAGRAKRKSK